MSNSTPGRWLLVAIAIIGLALVATTVSAHGNTTGADDAPPANATAAEWEAWMQDHLTTEEIDWMEQHSGLTIEEMAEHMAEDGHWGGDHMWADGHHGVGHMYGGGMWSDGDDGRYGGHMYGGMYGGGPGGSGHC